MLRWLRQRRQAEDIHRAALRPFLVLAARDARAFPALWGSPYSCTLAYYWTAVIADRRCGAKMRDADKIRALRAAFARLVEGTGGVPHEAMRRVLPDGHPMRKRALTDLKRIVALYNGNVDDRYMIYPEYREAVQEDGRPAPYGNRWGLGRERAHEILLCSCLAGTPAGRSLESA